MIYRIKIKGHLDRRWTEWFGGLTITLEDNGETLLTGQVADQAWWSAWRASSRLSRLSRCWGLVLGWVSSCGLYGWGSSGSAVAEARRREDCARSSRLDPECE
jgi:hypothetical protein